MFKPKKSKDWKIVPRKHTAFDPGNTKITEQLEAFKRHTDEFEKSNQKRKETSFKLENKNRLVDDAMEHIKSNPSTNVNVDGGSFQCHGLVLSMFSKRLREDMKKGSLNFQAPELSSHALDQIYRWVHGDSSVVETFDLKLFRAASFLAIPELVDEMWKQLDKNNLTEYAAFKMLCKSRKMHDIEELHEVMVSRISKSTLVIFSSNQFLKLNENQVSLLLKSDRLAVNSEMEIFYGGLCWLRYKWPLRRDSVGKVLQSIRFGFMSVFMLRKLTLSDRPHTGPFGDILDVFIKLPDFKKILADAMFYSSLFTISLKQPDCLKDRLAVTRMKLLRARCWTVDKRCAHHRPVSAIIPNMSFVSWEEFTTYMFMLQNDKTNIEDCIRCVDEPERLFCSGSESDLSVHSFTSSHTSQLSETSTTSVTSSCEDTSDAVSVLSTGSSASDASDRLTSIYSSESKGSLARQRRLTSPDK
ncbi:uncharacterized protein LOC117589707 [Drosophila guanche]|uniref:Blast:Kelch-like protein diablo n=1 Tax=Drosophila guanche TaxID=7266 RepID=A0A3B0KSJ1_DROGU|nr:uncharacterized protein LOC117589707 [Drosophila guanche]SPP88171.1 blast:Kelch-like protein diablo [Drosophila guanche]